MLPGDWVDGVFQFVSLGRWQQDMLVLRALAEPEPLKVTLADIERIMLGRIKKKTLQNLEKPKPVEKRGQTDVFLFSEWTAIWPTHRDPLPSEDEARKLLRESRPN